MLGVEHFFLFNLGGAAVSKAIAPWVAKGVATLVEWPYKGCTSKPSGRCLKVNIGKKGAEPLHLRSFQRLEQARLRHFRLLSCFLVHP